MTAMDLEATPLMPQQQPASPEAGSGGRSRVLVALAAGLCFSAAAAAGLAMRTSPAELSESAALQQTWQTRTTAAPTAASATHPLPHPTAASVTHPLPHPTAESVTHPLPHPTAASVMHPLPHPTADGTPVPMAFPTYAPTGDDFVGVVKSAETTPLPSVFPTYAPTTFPTYTPTSADAAIKGVGKPEGTPLPSVFPTYAPTTFPTYAPTSADAVLKVEGTPLPSVFPTYAPTTFPTYAPTSADAAVKTEGTPLPSVFPTYAPTTFPTYAPTSTDAASVSHPLPHPTAASVTPMPSIFPTYAPTTGSVTHPLPHPTAKTAKSGTADDDFEADADGSSAAPSLRVVVRDSNASATMKLAATLVFGLTNEPSGSDEAKVRVAIKYYPIVNGTHDPEDDLWSESVDISKDEGWKGSLPLYRLRPGHDYVAEVHANGLGADGDSIALVETTHFTSDKTGVPRFDMGPLATMTGDSPSWNMLTFTYQVDVTPDVGIPISWQGLIAIDKKGHVVWYWANDNLFAWDFLPEKEGHGIVLLANGDGSENLELSPKFWREGNGSHAKPYYVNSRLTQISPGGDIQLQYFQACTGSPENYNILSHELRIDAGSPDGSALTTANIVAEYPDVTLHSPGTQHWDDDTSTTADHFLGASISRWHRKENKLELVYNLFEWIMPTVYAPTTSAWNDQSYIYCAGDTDKNPSSEASWMDYHHVSSITTGPDDNLVVSFRNLNTIVSLYANGSGPMWVVSSSFSKDTLETTFPKSTTLFSFAAETDRFYEPHSVMQLSTGKLLLMDDGNSRPGCSAVNAYKGCYSRALMLDLDFDKASASAAWEFSDPYSLHDETVEYAADGDGAKKSGDHANTEVMTHDQFNWDGGSAYRLANGNVIVAFTSVYPTRDYNPNYAMYAWEVDGTTAERKTQIIVPAGYNAMQSSGGYRMTPWDSIGGEGADEPSWS